MVKTYKQSSPSQEIIHCHKRFQPWKMIEYISLSVGLVSSLMIQTACVSSLLLASYLSLSVINSRRWDSQLQQQAETETVDFMSKNLSP